MALQPTCTCGTCRICKNRIRVKKWRKDNPERVKEYMVEYRERNRDRFAGYSREWDARNPDTRRAMNAEWKSSPNGRRSNRRTARRAFDRKREWLDGFKQGPCTDCNKNYPPYVYDLDHVRGEKRFALSAWMNGKIKATEDEVLSEIAKCELRCANCHRLRHGTQLI